MKSRKQPQDNTYQQAHGLLAALAKIGFFLILTALVVTGCKKTEPEPLNPLVASAGADQPVQVGQLVTLDGTASRDGAGAPLTYQWAISRKPAKSTAVLAAPTTAKPTFTPDEVGEYELTLTVSNGKNSSSDNVLITASTAQPLTLDKDITVKTTLADRIINPNLPDYIVPRSIAVKHELTIEPGVIIAFERDTRFDINDEGGILIAKGTADKPIRFVGVNQSKGYWTGIMVYSESNVNLMEYVEVQHAGSRVMLDGRKAGMAMFKESQMALNHVTFTQNDGYGLFVQETAVLRAFSTNTFSSNTEAGILVSTENVARLDAASVFTSNNGRNVVEVNGSYVGRTNETTEIIWKGFADKTPYRILNDVAVRTGWQLSSGVTVEMARDVNVTINEAGYLLAKGTADRKIIFTGAGNGTAYWEGILSHSSSAKNSLDYVDIRNAGSSVIVSGKRANIALYGSQSTMTIRNTRISGSGGYGVWVGFGATTNDDIQSANTFDGNAQGAVEYDN